VLCGGASKLAQRAEQLCEDGRLDVACELVEYAQQAEPTNGRIRAVRAAVYRERARQESSLMAKSIFMSASRESDDEPSE